MKSGSAIHTKTYPSGGETQVELHLTRIHTPRPVPNMNAIISRIDDQINKQR
jgi:hypothetical protein